MKIETEPYYHPIGAECEVFLHVDKNRLPLLLKGPTGTGKTRFIEHMAYRVEKPLLTVTCHEETSSTDLIGRYIIKNSETVWLDGPLVVAAKHGYIIYLDEIAEARPDILVAIHSLSDYRRTLYIDKLGQELVAHPDFLLVASYNPGYQRGFKELKPSTRQRFVSLSFAYPNPEIEKQIVMTETGVDASMAKKLVSVGNKIRNLKEFGLSETASTRLLVDAGKLICSGLSTRLAVSAAVIEPLTDDHETALAITDVCNLIL